MKPHDATEQVLMGRTARLCESLGVELVDVRSATDRGERVIRVLIDRPRTDGLVGSGVTVDDCRDLSRSLGNLLDDEPELVPGAFRLEVSSPGLERPLFGLPDFERFQGREAKLRTSAPYDERKVFEGVLRGTDGVNVRIECSGRVHVVPHEAITKAHLVHRFT